mmetsp:Transcript_20148/g.26422  ORF Transcript_20148/g.26422 Transcript_20148/m.26422 type:complete len:174 (-) Transcript_20148:1576-2097(-)
MNVTAAEHSLSLRGQFPGKASQTISTFTRSPLRNDKPAPKATTNSIAILVSSSVQTGEDAKVRPTTWVSTAAIKTIKAMPTPILQIATVMFSMRFMLVPFLIREAAEPKCRSPPGSKLFRLFREQTFYDRSNFVAYIRENSLFCCGLEGSAVDFDEFHSFSFEVVTVFCQAGQ